MLEVYNERDREKILNTLVPIFKKQKYVEGVILVGSGAKGFLDRWSDLDFAVVVYPSNKAREVWNTLNSKVLKKLRIIKYVKGEYSRNCYITAFFTHNYMEVNMGIWSLNKLYAKRDSWKILYEKTDKIHRKLIRTWKNRKMPNLKKEVMASQDQIWHHIINGAFAFKRKNIYRAIKETEEIRNEIVKLWSLYENKESKHFREVDQMQKDFTDRLGRTFHEGTSYRQVKKAFKNVFELYFWTILKINPEDKSINRFKNTLKDFLKQLNLVK